MLDRSEREEVRLHQPRCQTLPLSLSVYKGTVAILDGNVVYGYNQNGDLLYSTNSGTGSKNIVLASDYTAYILSVNQIRFIDLDNVSSDDTAQTSKQE